MAPRGTTPSPAVGASDGPFQVLGVRIPRPLHRDVKVYCLETETTLEAFVRAALEEKLRDAGGEPPAVRPRRRPRAPGTE